jgi:hypothetical protein
VFETVLSHTHTNSLAERYTLSCVGASVRRDYSVLGAHSNLPDRRIKGGVVVQNRGRGIPRSIGVLLAMLRKITRGVVVAAFFPVAKMPHIARYAKKKETTAGRIGTFAGLLLLVTLVWLLGVWIAFNILAKILPTIIPS